ncbi:hypothetical protein [uncultured Roseobacter sp.]|uniref:hypothetical protein n=1 Tax=uncultured Roseobacter sp. TaxID=114847 RepID=UPI002609C7D1|nr:hypothetical protein [uncultured Roseobacter sp.]
MALVMITPSALSVPTLTEHVFLPMSPETTAWTLEQAQLRHSAEECILAELGEMIPNDLRIALLLDLLRVFGNAVAIALVEINL